MDFVTFEIARKLKDKGFDWETSNVYERNTLACRYEDYPKPTISQVLKWLRENKHLFVEIFMYHNHYMWEIYNTDMYNNEDGSQKSEGHSGKKYVSYELAALAGIEYVLDNLI